MRKTTLFKRLVLADEILVMPATHDALTARIIEQTGFQAVAVGGYSTSATLLGRPDVSLLTLSEMTDQIGRVADAVEIPVFADGDTGHGGIVNVVRTVKAIEKAGAAAMFLEDQVFPKRCGHMEGKQVVPAAEMIGKIKAALDARTDPDFCIMARTDALAPLGIDAAIERANQYRQAGADLIFVEAPVSIAQMERITREVAAPTMANNIEGGKTPSLPVKDLERIGYQLVAFATAVTYAVVRAVTELMTEIMETGTTDRVRNRMSSFDQFNKLVGLDSIRALERRYR